MDYIEGESVIRICGSWHVSWTQLCIANGRALGHRPESGVWRKFQGGGGGTLRGGVIRSEDSYNGLGACDNLCNINKSGLSWFHLGTRQVGKDWEIL